MTDAQTRPVAGAAPGQPPGLHSARTEANARLTSTAGLILLVLLAVQGVTILRIHRLLTAHIVLGLILLGPLVVKLGSTGWRFLRYYTGDADYERAGPPRPLLRVLAPVLLLTTLVVFASGIALLLVQPGRGSTWVLVHKVSFILWFGVMTVHVLAYVWPAAQLTVADLGRRGPAKVLATRRSRQLIVGFSLIAGVVLGVAGRGWAHSWVTRFGSAPGGR